MTNDPSLKETGNAPVELTAPLKEAFVHIRVAQLLKARGLEVDSDTYNLLFEVGKDMYEHGMKDSSVPLRKLF